MKRNFRLTKPAIQDVEKIMDAIARQSGVGQANEFLMMLDQKMMKVAQFPKLRRQRNEILPGLRIVPIDPYLIFYVAFKEEIDILRVVSGYRDLTGLFNKIEG